MNGLVLATPVMEPAVFVIAAVAVLSGALGVILAKNPVHAALSLVGTLFGIAVLFIAQDAQFLAAVQVIVYAGAIVVLFLFVIMLLGVDRLDDLDTDPLVGQRPVAIIAGILLGAALLAVLLTSAITGQSGGAAKVDAKVPNVTQLGRVLFTSYLFPFEITSVLLIIAVVGAVVLARGSGGDQVDGDEPVTELGRPPADDEDEADLSEATT